jgi:ankyrin repeat protein
MENTHTKTILMEMIFLSSGLCHNAVQASFLLRVCREKQPSSFKQSLNKVGKGILFWRQPTQKGYFHWFRERTPDYVSEELEQAVYNKKPGTVLKILYLNRIFPRLDIQENNLQRLLHIAIQNHDSLSLGALVNARYRDEYGIERPLFDINFEYNGLTPTMLAIWCRRTEMIDFLIREGADPLKISPEGTALHFAIEVDDFDSLTKINQYLLNGGQPQKRKQFLNQPNASGETIFHTACRNFRQE